jgi:group I intron endonuclease
MIGIYKITSPSGKVYIGQSWDIKSRWTHYKQHGRKHKQAKLENSFDKYGVKNHKFEICHELPSDVSQDVLDRYEQFYMDLYRDCGIELLNLREGGYGAKHTQESKDKIAKAHLGKPKHTKESKKKIGKSSSERTGHITWNKGLKNCFSKKSLQQMSKSRKGLRAKTVLQYDKQGIFIKEWSCISNATKELNISNGKITMVAQGKRKQTGGFIWKYKKTNNERINCNN